MAIDGIKETASVMRIITAVVTHPAVRVIALLGLCAAYLQGGGQKLLDFGGAVAEARHFGLEPAAAIAAATIITELAASVLILTGFYRWSEPCCLPGSRSWPPS